MHPALYIFILLLITGIVVLTIKLKQQRDTHASYLHSTDKQNKETLSQLEELQINSQITIDALSDAIFIVNSDLEVLQTNAKAKEIFNNPSLEYKTLSEIFMHSTFTAKVTQMIQKREATKEKITLSSSNHTLSGDSANGESAWIIQTTPLPNHIENPRSCIVLRDISTEHRTEQIRTDFVTNASHELRTPLAIINGYLENLLDDDIIESPHMARKMLNTMSKHGKRLSRLIDDMLVVSRLESGESAALNMEPFDLVECTNDVLERLDQIISSSSTTIIKQYEENECVLNGDRFYWTQALFNLIENAIKQNPNRQLEITVQNTRLINNQLQLNICDNGIGIPSAHLPFIFKRFYRVDKHHTQSDIKGTGLGLSIVKRAIEAHNGTIEVTSTPGTKTCFTIVSPTNYEHPTPPNATQ